jgi:hypothetical protein
MAMTATTVTSLVNKIAAHWVQKAINRRLQKPGILDTGATTGSAPEENEDAFLDTGKLSKEKHSCPGQAYKQSHEEDAPEAQVSSICKRDEHSAMASSHASFDLKK